MATTVASHLGHGHSHEHHDEDVETKDMAKIWAIGLVATLIISLSSMCGAAIIPFFRHRKLAENRFFHIFIGLAVATLTADAMLHMVPEIMGVHSHEGHDHHGSHEEHDQRRLRQPDATELAATADSHAHASHESLSSKERHEMEEAKYQQALLHMSILLGSIWLFYMLETIATCVSEARDQKAMEEGTSPYGAVAIIETPASRNQHIPEADRVGDMALGPMGKGGPAQRQSTATTVSVTTKRRETIVCWGLRPIALMILVGDAVHNFGDGLAIGAALNKSTRDGLSTSIAILCHELPHELGDFVVLLNSGLSVKKALVLNFLSALTAFLGLGVGIPLGGIPGARPWLFSLAAGMFLYVALVDMMHHMREMERLDPWWLTVLWQNIGLFLGFIIIFLIGFYEDDIHI